VQAGGTVQPGADVHDHGAPVADGAPLPTTGGGIPAASLLVLGLAGLASEVLRRGRATTSRQSARARPPAGGVDA
jgi:hypothetical protein